VLAVLSTLLEYQKLHKNIPHSAVTVKVDSEDATVLPLKRTNFSCVRPTIQIHSHFYSYRVLLIGHTVRQDCLLGHVIDGKIQERIQVTGRRGRRRKKLMDDLAQKRGYSKSREEAPDRTVLRSGSGTDYWTCRKTYNKTNE